MPFIKVIQPEEATGELSTIYQNLIKTRGKLAEVHKIQSLNPESIVRHMDLYMCLMFGKSPLKRYQREMLGVVVSSSNQCEYCVKHHSEALNHFWKDDTKTNQFINDFSVVDLSKVDISLCRYAHQLTVTPFTDHSDCVDQLFFSGLEDRAVLDAAMVISYFNYVNRMVLGLGVKLESDDGKGYIY